MMSKISASRSLVEAEIFYLKKPVDVQICHHSAMAGIGRFSFAVVLRAHLRPAVSHSAVQNPPSLSLYSQRTSAPPSYWNFFLVSSTETFGFLFGFEGPQQSKSHITPLVNEAFIFQKHCTSNKRQPFITQLTILDEQ